MPTLLPVVSTITATAAASHTADARAAQRVAVHCAYDTVPGSLPWPGRTPAASTSRPMVSAAAPSWTTRATGSP